MTAVREACWSDQALSDSLEPGAEIPAHVRVCVSCRVRRDGLARASRLLRGAPPAMPSEAARDAVLEAVWRAVRAPPARPAWSRPALAAAAAVLLLLGATAGFWAARPPDEAQLEPLGGAQFTRQRTRVGASSVEDEVVTLTEGRLRVAVGDLEPERRFRVLALDAELELRGAAVEVEVTERRLSAVHVVSGVVGVRRVGLPMVWLSAGQGWRTGERERAPVLAPEDAHAVAREDAHAVAREDTHVVEREAARVPRREAASDPASAPAFDRGPRRAVSAAERAPRAAPAVDPDAGPTPLATHAPVSEPDATASAPTSPLPVASATPSPLTAAPWARTPTTAPLDLTPPVEALASPARAPAPPTDRAALEEAAEQQFRWGWERLRVHDRRRAARHFAAAAALSGDGPLAEDARYWHARALVEADDDAADEACRDFLRRHPESPRWDELSLLLADRLTSRAPDEARALLRRVAAQGRSDRAAKARAALRALEP
jgi:hypothetical protein